MENMAVNVQLPVFPGFTIFILLAIGITLAVWKPFRGYLFSLFIPVALPIPTMTFTRFEGLGPYFNLYDACLVVMLTSVAVKAGRSQAISRLPMVPLAMLGVLFLGVIITTMHYGFYYETLRALRWGINVPLYFLGAFVMLRDERRHSSLLLTLFLGAVIAELQHLYFVLTNPALGDESQLGLLRSSMFQMAKSESWLLAGPYIVVRTIKWPWLQVSAAILFLAAAITTQTRTLALGLGGGFILYWLFFVRLDAARSRKYLPIAILAALITILIVIPRLNLGDVALGFTERLTDFAELGATDESAVGRIQALSLESSDWYEGGPVALIFGNGLDYFTQKYMLVQTDTATDASFGHVGYVTYLSQLGLIGFLIYAVWFPFVIVRRAMVLYRTSRNPATRHLAALGGAAFLYCAVAFIFSGHYLVTDVLAGTLAGFVYVGLGPLSSIGPLISGRLRS